MFQANQLLLNQALSRFQRMEKTQTLGVCLHTQPTRTYPHGRVRAVDDCNITADDIKKAQKEARNKSNLPSDRVGYLDKDPRSVLS